MIPHPTTSWKCWNQSLRLKVHTWHPFWTQCKPTAHKQLASVKQTCPFATYMVCIYVTSQSGHPDLVSSGWWEMAGRCLVWTVIQTFLAGDAYGIKHFSCHSSIGNIWCPGCIVDHDEFHHSCRSLFASGMHRVKPVCMLICVLLIRVFISLSVLNQLFWVKFLQFQDWL